MPPPTKETITAVFGANEAWPELKEAQKVRFHQLSVGNRDAKPFIESLTDDQRDEWHRKIMRTIFEMAKLRNKDHRAAFNESAKKRKKHEFRMVLGT
ncbi:hypothetical protein ACHAPE_008396 [Trichoderma viride]